LIERQVSDDSCRSSAIDLRRALIRRRHAV